MRDKIKNYGFWISLASSIFLLLQALGLRIDIPVFNEVVTALMGVLVVLGIVSNPSQGSGYKDN